MTEQTDVANLTYELMKRMRSEQLEMRMEITDLKMRVIAVEEHMQGVVTGLMRLNGREDRVGERLARIERRLDLRGTED